MESIIKQTAVHSHWQQQELHCPEHQHQQLISEKLQHATAQEPFLSTTVVSPNSSSTLANGIKSSDFQTLLKPIIEVCVFDDCSSDDTLKILQKWQVYLKHLNIAMRIIENTTGEPKGGKRIN